MFVFSNLATSLDGKIATASRELFPLGTAADRKLMVQLRKKADIVIFGAGTLRAYRKPCTATGMGKRPQPANAVLSSSLEGISPDWPFFKSSAFHRILFVGPDATEETLGKFSDRSAIIRLRPGKAPIASQIVRELGKRGYHRLLVEGGGSLMWDFASENLIDEYHVTLTPRILGGTEAPTLVDGPGFEPEETLSLKLIRARRAGDELYLTYRKKARRGR